MTTEISDRYRRIAEQFTRRVRAVPADAWENPSPCEGWLARDVVGHLVDWLPEFFFDRWDLTLPDGPTVKEDPLAAWLALDATIQTALDDPAVADRVVATRMGEMSFARQFDMIATTDVLFHTWDLARATGQDETLDPDEVHRFVESMEGIDEMLRTSGQFGARVPVPDDADEQTRLIGFLGRQP
jgi:uncharacterized protein (TIGR03086 family)